MNVKYQVFVSSTFDDLKDERDQVIKAVLEMGHVPVGMEMFSAADEQQWQMIARQIDQSDYYVVIVAHRFGSVTDAGISYTEKEYDYAVTSGVPVLGFVLEDRAPWPADRMDSDPKKRKALAAFRDKVKKKPVGFWRTADDLYAKVPIALMKAFNVAPRPGWVRADSGAGPEVVAELTRLSGENARLRDELAQLRAKERTDEDTNLDKAIELMRNTAVEMSIWREGGKAWESALPTTLLRAFEELAPSLLTEDSTIGISRTMGRSALTEDIRLRDYWPYPSNHVESILADLQSLGLVEPSARKHAVADTKQYWTLTANGRVLMGKLRKGDLEAKAAKRLSGSVRPPRG